MKYYITIRLKVKPLFEQCAFIYSFGICKYFRRFIYSTVSQVASPLEIKSNSSVSEAVISSVDIIK